MDSNRFCQLWLRNQNNPDAEGAKQVASDVFDLLLTNYSDPQRYYHDVQHIDDCLEWLDRYSDQVADPDAVELAIWFHDACYSPDPKGHELRGVALLRQLAGDCMPLPWLDKIAAMIGLTDHQSSTDDLEQALVLDIDLASFCRPWNDYLSDTARCRAEQKQLKGSEYCSCQLDFLRQLIGRPQIYFHPQFHANHEADARANIIRLIELLEARAERWVAA